MADFPMKAPDLLRITTLFDLLKPTFLKLFNPSPNKLFVHVNRAEQGRPDSALSARKIRESLSEVAVGLFTLLLNPNNVKQAIVRPNESNGKQPNVWAL